MTAVIVASLCIFTATNSFAANTCLKVCTQRVRLRSLRRSLTTPLWFFLLFLLTPLSLPVFTRSYTHKPTSINNTTHFTSHLTWTTTTQVPVLDLNHPFLPPDYGGGANPTGDGASQSESKSASTGAVKARSSKAGGKRESPTKKGGGGPKYATKGSTGSNSPNKKGGSKRGGVGSGAAKQSQSSKN